MAVPTYGQLVEKYLGKGKTAAQAHKIASSPIMRKKDVFDKPSWVDKVILKRLRRKKKKKVEKVEKMKPFVSTRHKTITGGLRRGGLSQAEINKLRGKGR